MSELTEDEHACLMIMAEGQNLIAMQNTRWYSPLMTLHAKDFCKLVGNNNYVITQRGTAALGGHEESLAGDLRALVGKQGKINANRQAVHAKMQEALTAIVSAARMSALTTGSTEITCCDQILAELVARAREQLK